MTSDFIADKIVMDGLTFDDVLLVPAYSEVLPREVSMATKFSRRPADSLRDRSHGHRDRSADGNCHCT